MFTVLGGLALLIGGGLVAVGMRGRRADDHPLCRRCRFDLTGRAAGSSRCPECGAELERSGAVVVGHRQRRRVPLAVGATLLGVTVPVMGLLGWGGVAGVNWLRYAPVPYLVREGTSTDPARRRPAWAELLARRGNGTLTAAQRDRVSDAALAYQSDAAKPWDPAVGDWLDDARSAGQLSDDRWQRYAAASWPTALGLRVRPRVRSEDPIPYWIDNGVARVGGRSTFYLEEQEAAVAWDGDRARTGPSHNRSMRPLSSGGGGASGTSVQPDTYAGRLPVGHHVLRLRTPIRILGKADETAAALATGTLDLSAPFDLRPADQPTVKIIRDPALGPGIRAALTVDVRMQVRGSFANVTVNVHGTPVGLGFAVFLRSAGQPEVRMGTVACPAGTAYHGYGIGMAYPAAAVGSKVDVLLRGDPAAAAGTTDTFEAWDGEVVFKDVVVQ